MENIRKPAVAGSFYPAQEKDLLRTIGSLVDAKAKRRQVLGCLLPHAGYIYSGKVAAHTASQIVIKNTVILLGPNHTGYGASFSIMSTGLWQTPLGDLDIDSGLAKQLLKRSRYLEEDSLAHEYEHSLEVELPILQYFKKDFKIVPVVILADELKALKEIGRGLAQVIQASGLGDSVVIIASSDMTHYEPREQAKKKDDAAIQAILELDEDKLMARIKELDITMCGYAPVIIMLCAVKLLGAASAELVKYQTSGEVTGDYRSVVGYAGLTVS